MQKYMNAGIPIFSYFSAKTEFTSWKTSKFHFFKDLFWVAHAFTTDIKVHKAGTAAGAALLTIALSPSNFM